MTEAKTLTTEDLDIPITLKGLEINQILVCISLAKNLPYEYGVIKTLENRLKQQADAYIQSVLQSQQIAAQEAEAAKHGKVVDGVVIPPGPVSKKKTKAVAPPFATRQ